MDLPHDGQHCVVCGSSFVLRFKDIDCSKIKTRVNSGDQLVRVYYCMECESFMSPQCLQADNGGSSLAWHKHIIDRNMGWSEELLDTLAKNGCSPAHIVELGCGIGTLLRVANARGIRCAGYDTDDESVRYGADQYGLNLKSELLKLQNLAASRDSMLVAISVLEHIKHPREILSEISTFLNRTRASAFISVPFINSTHWKTYLNDDVPCGAPPNVHVTLFSEKGFLKACKDLGIDKQTKIKAGGWHGFLLGVS